MVSRAGSALMSALMLTESLSAQDDGRVYLPRVNGG